MIETLIGQRYRIKALIGEGGMASVYLALDEKLERKVAIKIMHPHLARNVDIRERFLLEARTVSGLDHPNILRVYDFSGLDSEQLWIVMEILYGEDLAEYVKAFPHNRLQYIVATLITREICRALHEAHKLNIVHRDIKPENIMMLRNGHIKLMDFGIAKVHRANATQTGIFMGSPSYMSPEQIRGTDVDSRADIYSLSVLFYEILTGQLPFVGKSTAEVINRIMVGRYIAPKLLISELPTTLTEVIAKGMQHHKDERYSSITEMALALDDFLASINFRESRLELEEFSLNRPKFEGRIAEALTMPPTAHNALAPANSSLGFISKISRYQASYEQEPKESSTVILDQANAPTIPPTEPYSASEATHSPLDVQQKARPPISSEGRAKRDESRPSKPRGAHSKEYSPASPSHEKMDRNAGKFQSPLRSDTQPPKTPNSSPKSNAQRAVFREFNEDKKKPRSLALIISLILAVGTALFFILNIEHFTNKAFKVPTKVTERQKPVKKAEPEAEPTPLPTQVVETQAPKPVEGEAVPTPETVPTPEGDPVETPPSVDSQPVNKPVDQKPKPTTRPQPPRNQPVKPIGDKRPTPVTPVTPNGQKPKDTTLATLSVEKPAEDKLTGKPVLPTSGTERDKPTATGLGLLKLAALPAAEVYLDGKLYGTTNDKQLGTQGIKLESGTYVLRLKRKGYRTEEQAIQIRPGENRQINVTLSKLAEFVELSIRVNKLPATITIEEVKPGGRKREITMGKPSAQINLKPGTYKVNVSKGNESINRTMELTEENKSITFNADFK